MTTEGWTMAVIYWVICVFAGGIAAISVWLWP